MSGGRVDGGSRESPRHPRPSFCVWAPMRRPGRRLLALKQPCPTGESTTPLPPGPLTTSLGRGLTNDGAQWRPCRSPSSSAAAGPPFSGQAASCGRHMTSPTARRIRPPPPPRAMVDRRPKTPRAPRSMTKTWRCWPILRVPPATDRPPPPMTRGRRADQQFSYFQLRRLPSRSHSIASATRRARVSSRLASAIQSQ